MGHAERLRGLWRHVGFQLVFRKTGWTRLDLPAFVTLADENFQLLTQTGMLTGKKGDYLVRWPDGEHAVISAATHAAITNLLTAPAGSELTQAQETV